MKKFLLVLMVSTFLFTVTGCNSSQQKSDDTNCYSQKTVVKMPDDDTVNGYRTSSDKDDSVMPAELNAEDVTVGYYAQENDTSGSDSSESYCANTKTKVFHKATCSSVKKMKAENKITDFSRQKLISEGYTPCKRCKP